MMRNLVTLGHTLIMIAAVSAVVASVASAQGKLTTVAPATLTGTETGAIGSNALTAFGLRIECVGSTYTGHKVGSITELITSGSTTVTVTPHYNQPFCRMNPGNFPTTVSTNGCDYVAHLGATTGGVAGTFAVTVDLVCPVGQEITITVFTAAAKHTEGKPFCILHVPPQTGLAGAHATSIVGGDFSVTGTIEKIKVAKTNGGEDVILCPTVETSEGKLDIDVTFKGKDSLGNPTNMALSD